MPAQDKTKHEHHELVRSTNTFLSVHNAINSFSFDIAQVYSYDQKMMVQVGNVDVVWSLFKYISTMNTSNIHIIWLKRTELWDDPSEKQRKTESKREIVPQKYAGEFGGWDLFCISCLGEGVWSGGEEELGNSGASSCTDLRKHPHRSHNDDDVTRETRGYGNLLSGF